MLALAKLKVWLVLPSRFDSLFLRFPSLPAMRCVFGIDALGSYQRLKTAAGGLSLAHGPPFHDELSQRLRAQYLIWAVVRSVGEPAPTPI